MSIISKINEYETSLKGDLLLSMPMLLDPNFYRTVVCIAEHSEEGAFGIIINRVHPLISGKDIFNELKIEYGGSSASIPIYIGGPVNMNELFILHKQPFNWKRTRMVTDSIGLTDTLDIVEAIANGKGPDAFLMAVGCCGWIPGQLENELQQNAWLSSPLSNELIFDTPAESRWKNAFRKIGITPELFSGESGNA